MKLFQIFNRKDNNHNDPYWVFNEKKHFKPQLNKGDYYKLSGFDFGWFVLEPLSNFVQDKEHEIERGKALSYGQKALYYWWYLDAQVTNGGFVQFYYNGYGDYMPTIIKGLQHIGDIEMAELAQKAENIYQKNKKLMTKAQQSDLFGSDLYERLDELSVLDNKYYKMNGNTMSLIEDYVRKNPNEICIDEDGSPFDLNYSGTYKTYYEDQKLKEEFSIQKGHIHGAYKTFFQNGNLKESITYIEGKKTGIRQEFYENDLLKYEVTKSDAENKLIHKWFYESGIPKKIEERNAETDKKYGELKEWYDNGQLKEEGYFANNTTRIGKWFLFWKDGSKKLEGEATEEKVRLINYWNENGEQTLINGTGIYYSEWISRSKISIYETTYKNFVRDGVSKSITNDKVTLYQEFKDGKQHGYTRTYYNNGNLKEEKNYELGKLISSEELPMFKDPKVKTTIVCEMEDEWLINRKLETADSYPIILNKTALEGSFKASVSLFDNYPQDYELSYNYFVSINEEGHTTNSDFLMASNGFLREEVESSIRKMKFKPALKNGTAINSYIIVHFKLRLSS
ncbi:DUF4375 domain-containing protein [Maribacter sp. Asnod1-A12]|uniref:DMP19 family protein n=1 Tax=Maribacter sp. Asnod1-A12 TaxID=3160576 RepID=UPI00386BE464